MVLHLFLTGSFRLSTSQKAKEKDADPELEAGRLHQTPQTS